MVPPMTKDDRRPVYIPYSGPTLLEIPLLNKGSAFTEEERRQFNLAGLLPYSIESIEEQSARAYGQLQSCHYDLDRHVYLRSIQDTNETLYFRLVTDHLEEIMPLIYTPTVGKACQLFSRIYRHKRGLFLAYPDRGAIDDILHNATKPKVKVIVLTDSERILGLGDQGIGGMGIPIGKLSLYTACGGISPAYTLPITLDVGCNNAQLLSDPMYMGWRHERITGAEYDEFVDQAIQAIKRRWPRVLLQFEDFAQAIATPLLHRYRDQLCCFNDDIQGTAAVTVGTLLAACQAKGERLREQTIAFVGAGSAGCGIAEQIVQQMLAEGLEESAARSRIFMTNSKGLLLESSPGLRDFQRGLCQRQGAIANWNLSFSDRGIGLLDVVRNAKCGVLIGVSGQPGLFNEAVVRTVFANCPRPIILPLSNPTSQAEALPVDILNWTEGKAIVATGSPFEPVTYGGQTHHIAQCNNSYIFPGVGLGAIAVGATRITDNMLSESSRALAHSSPLVQGGEGRLLPDLGRIRDVSRMIARAVARQAIADGVALEIPDAEIAARIEENFWKPAYRHYRRSTH
jgi:malate dehydrogenase (oxaloacetate-decarboxylating)